MWGFLYGVILTVFVFSYFLVVFLFILDYKSAPCLVLPFWNYFLL